MHLLIPHPSSLKKEHASKELGDIPGELQVNLVKFRNESTRFCLAYLQKIERIWQLGHNFCKEILTKAGSYKIQQRSAFTTGNHETYNAMSSAIFADIGCREITEASDLLAITANCCDYFIRLNIKSLKRTYCSLSLCILALYLLNGEIIKNDKLDKVLLCGNIFEYLKSKSLNNFNPPVKKNELTFIKRCRFAKIEFSPNGIIITDYLWRLNIEIDTTALACQDPFKLDQKSSPHDLQYGQRSLLQQFARELNLQGHEVLDNDIYKYLHEDVSLSEHHEPSSKKYKDLMAEKVVQAITERKPVQLEYLVSNKHYRGIFVIDSYRKQQLKKSYVFTAWDSAQDRMNKNYIDKFVSLEVDMIGSSHDMPQLIIKRWLNELCFFEKSFKEKVVFP